MQTNGPDLPADADHLDTRAAEIADHREPDRAVDTKNNDYRLHGKEGTPRLLTVMPLKLRSIGLIYFKDRFRAGAFVDKSKKILSAAINQLFSFCSYDRNRFHKQIWERTVYTPDTENQGDLLRDDITDMIAYALWRHWKQRPPKRDLSATRRWARYATAHLDLCGIEWTQKPPADSHSDANF